MKNKKIAVLGLGYVGLPLAVGLSSSYKVTGFDISSSRISQLKKGLDKTLEITKSKLLRSIGKNKIFLTDKENDLKDCNVFIATVPTPIDCKKKPDFAPLKNVCKIIGRQLKKDDVVIFESTVHPGTTEEICGPELEKSSKNLKVGKDFFLGYSPERVNPGDKLHTIDKISKVVAGQNNKTEKLLEEIYSNLTKGEVFLAKSIKVAEASKVIENSQRDINIAFINEITKICQKLNVSIYDVLDASSTKWNFLPFFPGLVGGHCIGVDPYYLAEKAKKLNIDPKVILSGRDTNDNMSSFIGELIDSKLKRSSKILFLGITFKEDVPDIRNSKGIELLKFLKEKNHKIIVSDPFFETLKNFNYKNFNNLVPKTFDSIVLCVPHKFFLNKGEKILKKFLRKGGYFFDIKGVYKNKKIDNYWCL